MKAKVAVEKESWGEVTALNWNNKVDDPRSPEKHNKDYLSW